MDRNQVSGLRRMLSVRAVARAWREQDSARTLLACSGGADSSALVLALAAAIPAKERAKRLVVAHVVHDMRPREQSLADAARARQLAELVGVAYVQDDVQRHAQTPSAHGTPRPGDKNPEARARLGRYAALLSMARANGCDAIATAHHSGDQAETVLMRMLRGTSVLGLRGVHQWRDLEDETANELAATDKVAAAKDGAPRVRLIRPMLPIAREDAEQICRTANWQWCEDATNADTDRTRAWVRHVVLPMFEAEFSGATRRIARMADSAAAVGAVVVAQRDALLRSATLTEDEHAVVLNRKTLRSAMPTLVGYLLREVAGRVCDNAGMDSLAADALHRATKAVQDQNGNERRIRLGGASLKITRDQVQLSRAAVKRKVVPNTKEIT